MLFCSPSHLAHSVLTERSLAPALAFRPELGHPLSAHPKLATRPIVALPLTRLEPLLQASCLVPADAAHAPAFGPSFSP